MHPWWRERGKGPQSVQVEHVCREPLPPKGIIHLNLKPDNVAADARSNSIKLIDFGLSASFAPGQKLNRFWGTLPYCAPEIIQGQEYECPLVDIWSLGVTLFLMLTERCPFKASTSRQLQKLMVQVSYDILQYISEDAHNLIQQMLMVDPTQKPTLEQAMEHPWLSQGQKSSPSPSSQPLHKHPDPSS